MSQKSVLLLNMNYMPIKVLSWQRAVGLVLGRGKAQILMDYENQNNSKFNAAVVRLTVKVPDLYHTFDRQKFSKRNVFSRDGNTCQYCAKRLVGKELTIDHVVPRAKGGLSTYMNCVTACKKCNSKKDDKSLEESGLSLIRPVRLPSRSDLFNVSNIPSEWRDFLG